MSGSKLKELILDVADELKTNSFFLEKDYYVSKVLSLVSDIKSKNHTIAFGGGTSLFKAYGIINRFSEDIDFKVYPLHGNTSRAKRKEFRSLLVDLINRDSELKVLEDSIISRNLSQFFSFYIKYPKEFADHDSMRPEIKLEVSFLDFKAHKLNDKTIKPKIGEYKDVGGLCNISCVPPEDIMSDKLSALAWRILSRDRKSANDDKTIIRHLYDIAMLYSHFKNQLNQILTKAKEIYLIDSNRADDLPPTLNEALNMVCKTLHTDPLYEKEYEQFVSNMCFGKQESIDFKSALKQLESSIYD